MVNLYVSLIQRGLWTLDQVPALWRGAVESLMAEVS